MYIRLLAICIEWKQCVRFWKWYSNNFCLFTQTWYCELWSDRRFQVLSLKLLHNVSGTSVSVERYLLRPGVCMCERTRMCTTHADRLCMLERFYIYMCLLMKTDLKFSPVIQKKKHIYLYVTCRSINLENYVFLIDQTSDNIIVFYFCYWPNLMIHYVV